MKKFLILSIILAFSFTGLIPEDAFAKVKDLHKYNMLQSKGDNDFYAEITPYVWWATPDQGIEFVENDTKFSAGFNASLKKGKWGYFGDVSYIKFDSTFNDGNVYGSYDLEQLTFTNAATFYLYKIDRTWLELMAGVRTLHFDIEGSSSTTSGDNTTETWNEPFIGLRWQWEFCQRWYSEYIANYGGFDFDGAEDSYLLGANLGFRINKKSAVKLGYIFYSTDYDHDNFQFKNEQDGVFVGYSRFF